jgi:hypothetical protein
MLTVIGIGPLAAAIRDYSDNAKTITQRHCAQEQGPLVIRSGRATRQRNAGRRADPKDRSVQGTVGNLSSLWGILSDASDR